MYGRNQIRRKRNRQNLFVIQIIGPRELRVKEKTAHPQFPHNKLINKGLAIKWHAEMLWKTLWKLSRGDRSWFLRLEKSRELFAAEMERRHRAFSTRITKLSRKDTNQGEDQAGHDAKPNDDARQREDTNQNLAHGLWANNQWQGLIPSHRASIVHLR